MVIMVRVVILGVAFRKFRGGRSRPSLVNTRRNEQVAQAKIMLASVEEIRLSVFHSVRGGPDAPGQGINQQRVQKQRQTRASSRGRADSSAACSR